MKGFFTGNTPQQSAQTIRNNTKDPCEECGLYKNCITPKMMYTGGGEKSVLIIGEAPGKQEDEQGEQFIGESGMLFNQYTNKMGFDIHRDAYKINAINCRPAGNRTPTVKEISCCRRMVQETIRETQPKFIWLVGESAIKSMYSGRFSTTSIARWNSLCIPDKKTGSWIIPMYHPSFALRAKNDKNKTGIFERGVRFAVSCLTKPEPDFFEPEDYVKRITTIEEVTSYLTSILEKAKTPFFLAIDWETSSLKPFYGMQKIWSCAFCEQEFGAVSFPVEYTGHFDYYQQQEIKFYLKKILQNKNILKIAHNTQFERMWATHLGTRGDGWAWCTQVAAHVLDTRRHFTGLKFQSYINFGVEGYEKELNPLMEKTHKETNLNMLDTAPLDKLLLYNGTDALLTYYLFAKQYPILNRQADGRSRGYKLFHNGLIALCDSTITGIAMDEFYYKEKTEELKRNITQLEEELTTGGIATEFYKITGRPLSVVNKDFGASDLRVVLYDILKTQSTKETKTGLQSVDAEVVETLNIPWAKKLVKWRKLNKILTTYLGQFIREICPDGRMHPFFPLNKVETTRGSSEKPNFTNIPNRDEEAKQVTRQGVMPSSGRMLGSIDYGSQEVRVAAILSKDPRLVWYCSEPNSDMHMDVTCRNWALEQDEVTGLIRFHSKSGFTFAEIYGSFYINCAMDLWENCIDLKTKKSGITLRQHLKNVGIIQGPDDRKTKMRIRGKVETIQKHLADFIAHIKEVENWFWEEFAGLREWQERIVKEYQSKGYVEMPFGFRRGGLLTTNKLFNTGIQGTAFHILLWSYIRINKLCKTIWDTDIIGQIHDEIVLDIPPNEIQDVLNTCEKIMTKDVVEENPWIIVPLVIEPEITPINSGWVYKAEMIKNKDNIWVFKND